MVVVLRFDRRALPSLIHLSMVASAADALLQWFQAVVDFPVRIFSVYGWKLCKRRPKVLRPSALMRPPGWRVEEFSVLKHTENDKGAKYVVALFQLCAIDDNGRSRRMLYDRASFGGRSEQRTSCDASQARPVSQLRQG